jgi:hypothetical protein
MSARSTACGTISRGQSCIDSVHVVVEQDHVLRRTPVWRRRYEGREIERARNREDPDTARKWDDLERTAPVVSFPGTAWVCTTCTAGLRVGRVRLARELRGRARGWTSLARGGRQGLHDLTWCAADPGTVLWTARGASPATGASRVTALTISVFVWCVRPPSRGSTHGRGRATRACVQPVEQDSIQRRPHPGRLPVAEPSPAGHAGIVAHLLGQPRPRDAGVEHEGNALQRLAIVERRAAALRARRSFGEQGRHQCPERVGDQMFGYPPRLPPHIAPGRFRYALSTPRE